MGRNRDRWGVDWETKKRVRSTTRVKNAEDDLTKNTDGLKKARIAGEDKCIVVICETSHISWPSATEKLASWRVFECGQI
jgi:hypothetical protein